MERDDHEATDPYTFAFDGDLISRTTECSRSIWISTGRILTDLRITLAELRLFAKYDSHRSSFTFLVEQMVVQTMMSETWIGSTRRARCGG